MSTPFAYQFTRTVNNVHWTANIVGNGQTADIEINRGPIPHWHTLENGTCLIDSGFSSHCCQHRCSRIRALRFVACAMANLHGGGLHSGGNYPDRPYRIWSPKRLKQLNREIVPTGKWVEFDSVNFDKAAA